MLFGSWREKFPPPLTPTSTRENFGSTCKLISIISLGGPHLPPTITPPAVALAESWAGGGGGRHDVLPVSCTLLCRALGKGSPTGLADVLGSQAWRPRRRAARTVPSAPWVGSAVGLESEGLWARAQAGHWAEAPLPGESELGRGSAEKGSGC